MFSMHMNAHVGAPHACARYAFTHVCAARYEHALRSCTFSYAEWRQMCIVDKLKTGKVKVGVVTAATRVHTPTRIFTAT